MNWMLWIVRVVLAVVFLASGTVMLTLSRARMIAKLGAWIEAVPTGAVRLLGALEVLAAIGLVVPPLVGIAPALAPAAAGGVFIVMVGAIVLHAREREYLQVVMNLALAAMAVFVAWGQLAS